MDQSREVRKALAQLIIDSPDVPEEKKQCLRAGMAAEKIQDLIKRIMAAAGIDEENNLSEKQRKMFSPGNVRRQQQAAGYMELISVGMEGFARALEEEVKRGN